MEQKADHSRHKKYRYKNGDQRAGNRNNRETHFPRATQRRLKWRHTVFDMADDVFKHDDRVVHHQANRHRQAQQRDVVQAVREPPEQRDRTHQRNRQ